ncbi:MAG: glycosyltransferase family 2 protein [Thermoanaerobaculia bacterium]|nr:glycosyltransferase family 2 protein [Thermoanaerobaculia bacterium]
MKLLIQIPAWDEEEHIGRAVSDLPRSVPGFASVEILVIDDGSTDATAHAAREAGADHILRLPIHQGLAGAWKAGLDACLRLGADVIVSTDADSQYDARAISDLVAPILRGEAEYVVGDRDPGTKADFSPLKRLTQRFGSWVVRRTSGTEVPDATSGFRALSREAALKLNVFSRMTYTIETLIQAGNKEMAVSAVKVRTNPPVRPSRLFRKAWRYVLIQGANILRMTALYKPLPVFFGFSALLVLAGSSLVVRYIYFVIIDQNPRGHVQSLLLATVLFLAAVTSFLTGLLADLISINRTLLEDILLRLRRQELRPSGEPLETKQPADSAGTG